MQHDKPSVKYEKGSLSLWGAVSMGTGVMIGAGIFALTGQIAELAGTWFPLAFLCAAIIAGFSSYSYIKMSEAFPSAGGIAMFLEKAYGKTSITASCALLMYFSMVINESLVARTFGTYVMRLFPEVQGDWIVPALGAGLIVFTFMVNILSNKWIQSFSAVMAFVKIAGLLLLAGGGLWASGLQFKSISYVPRATSVFDFVGAVAIGILAFKGFTTITNSGSELKNPKKNLGRAIVISLIICFVVYMLVCFAVGGNLSLEEIIQSKNYALAEAAYPAFGKVGLWITVFFAIAATISGIIASVFAVSRMLAMLTEMKLVPHSHFGMPGNIQKHTLVYTVVLAMLLTLFFDLTRIASLGALFYITMDILVQWGVYRHLRDKINAKSWVLILAICLDLVALFGLIWVKIKSDKTVIFIAVVSFVFVYIGEKYFLKYSKE